MKKHEMRISVGGQDIIFETGKIARQANGSVLVRSGDTMVLATACASPAPLDVDFLPLRIDYQEKFAAAGRTAAGYIKREGKPTERETLVCRLIDRPLRPMFEDGYYHDTQILAYVWSYDGKNSPDVLAICAASCALAISDIPLVKPIGACRVGMVDGEFVINPTVEQQKSSKLELMIAGTEDAVLMIEGSCDFLTEDQVLKAIELGHAAIRTICQAIHNWQTTLGKPKKKDTLKVLDSNIVTAVESLVGKELEKVTRIKEKQLRDDATGKLQAQAQAELTGEGKYAEADVKAAFKKVNSDIMRKMIINDKVRSDGRSTTEIRQIDIEQSLLPRAHGSSLFTRGETQTMAICVLGGETMAQRFENLEGEGASRFYMQYFFPPFSVGEVGRVGAPGRREVGHGKLAERALQAILPTKEQFPYTIRLESNITESNGSSSMASVCGGCLALMDAGVPVERPISGIAMGLILEKDHAVILSDILGVEDALGDMDFKVAGDAEGITSFQMDIKVEGITIEIMRKALAQAKEGRIHILNKMLAVCPKPREEMSEWAPRIVTLQVKPSKIGTIIGPGGKQIRAIIEETGVEIDINDEGIISISSANLKGIEEAKRIIYGLTAEVEVGKTYEGKITSVVAFGVFVEILPGKEGLCHISELDTMRIENIFDYTKDKCKVGDTITVTVLDINDRGQVKLSRRALLPKKPHVQQPSGAPAA
ncbi:MAG: polyribonucleotide nucleotidyltransferase [Verrucomicrobia bacterium]|nr:polyribonucleotide nucleotidyltransferase [Verrucomicrobiota bacterium]MBS0636968.1 polyribonucleotide nucleotidyltransferase [Verrucomicrobiota bacterium]